MFARICLSVLEVFVACRLSIVVDVLFKKNPCFPPISTSPIFQDLGDVSKHEEILHQVPQCLACFYLIPSLKGSSISELAPVWRSKALLSCGSLLTGLSLSPRCAHCGLTTAWCLPLHSKLGTVESVPKQRRLFLRCPRHLFRKMLKQHDEVGQTRAAQELTSGLCGVRESGFTL